MKNVREFSQKIKEAGGRALLVGGAVRDSFLGLESKDLDVEVFGLSEDKIESIVRSMFPSVDFVGRAFGVFKTPGMDISIPRKDSKIGTGHNGFVVNHDHNMTVEEAASRRDLTINAVSLDPLTSEIIDPFHGIDDINKKVLRVVNPNKFGEDPLRGLRVAQFAARFDFAPDAELCQIMSGLDLSELPGERIFEEFRKLLLKGQFVSKGLRILAETGLIRFFPELEALIGCQQEPEFHPEGDVFVHTAMVVDEAAQMRNGDEFHDLALMFGSLCHDFGKPSTTEFVDGRVRSRGHELAGVEPTKKFLSNMRASNDLVEAVSILVEHHLAPGHFARGKAKPSAFRRLARKLGSKHLTMKDLFEVASADHFGRTTPDAIERRFEDGDFFMSLSRELKVDVVSPKDVVLGRHLIARGFKPGPEIGKILTKCREVQFETGLSSPEEILAKVL